MSDQTNLTPADYIKLAEVKQRDFKDRRDLEWKLSLGTWGAIAALLYAIGNSNVLLNAASTWVSGGWMILVCVVAIILWSLHALVIFCIQTSHHRSRGLYWHFVSHASGQKTCEADEKQHQKRLDGTEEGKLNPLDIIKGLRVSDLKERWNFKTSSWYLYHVLTTGIVMFAAIAVVNSAATERSQSKESSATSNEATVKNLENVVRYTATKLENVNGQPFAELVEQAK